MNTSKSMSMTMDDFVTDWKLSRRSLASARSYDASRNLVKSGSFGRSFDLSSPPLRTLEPPGPLQKASFDWCCVYTHEDTVKSGLTIPTTP